MRRFMGPEVPPPVTSLDPIHDAPEESSMVEVAVDGRLLNLTAGLDAEDWPGVPFSNCQFMLLIGKAPAVLS